MSYDRTANRSTYQSSSFQSSALKYHNINSELTQGTTRPRHTDKPS